MEEPGMAGLVTSGQVLDWQKLYKELSAEDCYPTQKFAETLKSFANECVTELDFTGIQQLTDEAFVALRKVLPKTKLRETIVKVNCTGCTNISDFGVENLAQALPFLTQVILDGCHRVTSLSLVSLVNHCTQLRAISAVACSITWLPKKKSLEDITLCLDGCPLLPNSSSDDDAEQRLPTQKMLIMTHWFCSVDIFKFLTGKDKADLRSDYSDKTKQKKLKFDYYPDVKLGGIESSFNIFELQGLIGLHSMIGDPECLFVIAMDISGPHSNKNPQLHIMNRVSYIKTQAPHAGVIILGLHSDETKQESTTLMTDLGRSVTGYLKQQAATLEEHLQHDSFDSDFAKARDFQTQQRYCRSLMASKFLCYNYFFAVNRDTNQVLLRWPLERALSTVNRKMSKFGSNENDAKLDLKTKRLNELEKVKMKLAGINKSDIAELRSVKKPTAIMAKTVTAMTVVITNGAKQRESINFHDAVSNYTFLSDMMNYDMENMSEEVVKEVKDIMGDGFPGEVQDEQAKACGQCLASMHQWLRAVFLYVTDCLLEERLEQEIQRQEQAKRQEKHEQESKSQGPKAIFTVIESIISKIYNKQYPERKIRQTMKNVIQDVEMVLKESAGLKVMTFDELRSLLLEKDKNFSSFSDKAIAQLLKWLRIEGKILWFSDMESQPIVTDIRWYVRILNKLRDETCEIYRPNGRLFRSLAPDTRLLNHEILSNWLSKELSPQNTAMFLDILTSYGVLLPVPETVTLGTNDSKNSIFFMREMSSEQPFLRTGLDEGTKSTIRFKEKVWPQVGTGTWHQSDVNVGVLFSFTTNMPVNLLPRILAEWIRMGEVISLWQTGCIARCGATEIILRQDVHGTQVSNSIYAEARLTKGWTSEIDHSVLSAYIWGSLSKYVLVIEAIINEYPTVHVIISMPCMGSCRHQGTATFFPVTEIQRSLCLKLQCNLCESHQQMTSHELEYLTGRQHFLPFHDFKPLYQALNPAGPYAKSLTRTHVGDDNVWACSYCGVAYAAALRLWAMECRLYPSFSVHSFETLGTSEKFSITQIGNVISVGKVQKIQKRMPSNLLQCKQPLFLSGLTRVDVTILDPGPIVLAVGKHFSSKQNPDSFDLDKCNLKHDFLSGTVMARQIVSDSEDDLPALSDIKEVVSKGDTITLEIMGEETIEITDRECTEAKQRRTVLKAVLRKNGRVFYSASIPYSSYFGLLLQATNDTTSRVVVQATSFPHVRAAHFPLHSSVLYKTGAGNQWTAGYVVATNCNGVHVSSDSRDFDLTKTFFAPLSSSDLLPVGQYSDGMSILLGKELMKSRDHLLKFLRDSKALPAPFGLFQNAPHRLKDQFMNLRMNNHEPRVCVWNSYCPEVLEQSYVHFMETDGKSQKQRQEWSLILLPSSISVSTLLNPMRHTSHDWDNQDMYFICKGSEWSSSISYQRDAHFLDVAPISVPRDILQNLIRHYRSLMVLAYFNMENRQTILPFLSRIFPNFDSEMDKRQLLDSLSQLMFLYRSTFLLFRLVDQTHRSKNKASKDMGASFQTALKALVTAAQGSDADLLSLQSSALCETHSLVAKKSSLSDAILDYSELEWDNKLRYSSCILHLEASGVIRGVKLSSLSSQQKLDKLLHFFPNLQSINLSSNEVECIDGISACASLKHLILHGNQLQQLPEEMVKVKDSIMTLDLSLGPLSFLPDFICEFKNLRQLKVGYTLVSELPKQIGNLTRLRALDLGSCPISSLPESFRQLRSLETLHLQGVPTISSNLLKDGGTSFTKSAFHKFTSSCPAYSLLSQEELDRIWDQCDTLGTNVLGWPEIKTLNEELFRHFPRFGNNYDEKKPDKYGGIPAQVFSLVRLRTLNLSCQAIHFVPSEIKRLPRLTVLILADNPFLEVVSGEVGQCSVLNLDNCPLLKTPPKEIREQGMKTVIAYLKRLSQGSRACYQTKMMIVGLGGVGKTSLVRALMSPDFMAPSTGSEGITDGIAISSWSVKQSDQMLTFSVWDFAGQTVYYNTHQFFLSHRAIYLLAWNMRHGYEHAGLEFWLSSIACHCPNAPVIIVGTHADQISEAVLPETQFLKNFPNIVDFFTVSAVNGQGVKDLMARLFEVTLKQPYIGEMVPEAWLSLERAILSKRNQASLLDWNNVEKLAQSAGIYGIEVKQAVYFLHDLGTLQYFDNDLLRDKVVINPQWIVDVMACLVSANNKFCQDGRLKHKDIGLVWKNYPKELHKWLLRLTEYFDLTFPLVDEAQSIIPCLLPPSEPQFQWPEEKGDDGIRETKVLYSFKYLPAGLFNRAQVRLYQFSDSSVIWKTGSLLRKNDHYALMTQTSNNKIQVKVLGPQPDNIILMLHEVIEGLISQFFTGIRYQYEIPCPACQQANVKKEAMLSSKVLRRALELKPLFLQCHTHFHTLSATDVQNAVLPQSTQEFNVQLQKGMSDLASYKEELAYDLFFMYCQSDVPLEGQNESKIHPYQVYQDLKKDGYKCWYVDDLHQRSASDVAEAIQHSKLIVVFISDDFINNPLCQRMFQFAKDTLKKDFILLMVGSGREWQKSEIGLQVSSVVYVNLQKAELYEERILMIRDQIHQKLKPKEDAPVASDVFISYCWTNSNAAVQAGDCRPQEGAVGFGDPRLIKEFLEQNGISCWMDIEKVGRMGLFADIAEGMKASKVVLACISDEYAKSENCKMEFRFAHISLKKPIILVVVGTGFEWESTELGMLSLGYKKINFQVTSKFSQDILLRTVFEVLASVNSTVTLKSREQKEKAFKELYEALQRKFLRQLSSYVEDEEPFPHIFTIDFKDQPFDLFSLPDTDCRSNQEYPSDIEDIDDTSDISDLPRKQFCLKFLCEFEGGWHCVDEGLAIQLNNEDMATVIELAAPYFARILSILKHTHSDLTILQSEEGRALLNRLKSWDNSENQLQIHQVYLALRRYLIQKDKQHQRGTLKRCYMPSGKHLWLCEEHQQLPRVMVLSDTKEMSHPVEGESEDYVLLKSLLAIRDENDSVSLVFDDVFKLKVLRVSRSMHSEKSESSSRPIKNNTGDLLLSPVPKTVQSSLITEDIRPSGREKEKKGSQSPAQENRSRSGSPAKENSLFPGKQSRAGSPTVSLFGGEKVPKRSQMGERRRNMNIIGLASAAGNTKDVTSTAACILL